MLINEVVKRSKGPPCFRRSGYAQAGMKFLQHIHSRGWVSSTGNVIYETVRLILSVGSGQGGLRVRREGYSGR